ncbi:hypothetical protein GN956_G18491 [Arapaima gigas]
MSREQSKRRRKKKKSGKAARTPRLPLLVAKTRRCRSAPQREALEHCNPGWMDGWMDNFTRSYPRHPKIQSAV